MIIKVKEVEQLNNNLEKQNQDIRNEESRKTLQLQNAQQFLKKRDEELAELQKVVAHSKVEKSKQKEYGDHYQMVMYSLKEELEKSLSERKKIVDDYEGKIESLNR